MLVTFADEGSPARSSCTILRCLSRAAALLPPNRILPQRISPGELHSVFRFKVLMSNQGNHYVPRVTESKRDSFAAEYITTYDLDFNDSVFLNKKN